MHETPSATERLYSRAPMQRSSALFSKIWGAFVFAIFLSVTPVKTFAFTAADADAAFNSYNNAFYVSSGGFGRYKYDTGGGSAHFWTQAEEIEMIIDAYERTGSSVYRGMVTETINGFINTHGSSWTWNTFNDDIMWMVIAACRGYQATGNTTFRNVAKANFDATYSRAWDTALGGGLWWTTAKQEKNACVNGPAAIAACLLHTIYGDSAYLDKAKAIYAWERSKLFNATTGQVWDHMKADGTITTWLFTYNQGTFIGAANYLRAKTGLSSYYDDALKAANYTKNSMCTSGILPEYDDNGDAGGFTGIFARWMARFMKDNNLQSTFLSWMQQNANAAWNVRRASDNLSWCKWRTQTPSGTRYSWGCSSSVVIMQVVPPDNTVTGAVFYKDANYGGGAGQPLTKGNYTLSQLQAKGVLNDWASSVRIPVGWTVIIYQHDNFTGTSWTLTSDNPNFTTTVGLNDAMSSCRIQ